MIPKATSGSTKNERWTTIAPPAMGVCSNSFCGVGESKNETLNISKAFVSNTKEKGCNTVVKSSEYLRRILIQQDFGGLRKRSDSKRATSTTRRQDPSLSSLNRRKIIVAEGFGGKFKNSLLSKPFESSFGSLSSISSISSMSTFGGAGSSESFNLISNIHKTNNSRYKRTQSPTPTQRSTNRIKNNLSRYNNMDSANSFGSISNNNRWRSSPYESNPSYGANSNDNGYNIVINSTHQRQRWQATSANQRESDQPIGSPVERKSSLTTLSLPSAS